MYCRTLGLTPHASEQRQSLGIHSSSMTHLTAIYQDDSEIHISPSRERYPTVVRDFILPHLDFFTKLYVIAGDTEYGVDQQTEIEFRLVQESPSLFAVTACDDYEFLHYYMTKNNLVSNRAQRDEVECYLWQDYELFGIMLQEKSSLVTITRDGCDKRIVLTDWDDGDVDPETLIAHLGRGPGHIRNPLGLLLEQ